MSQEPKFKRGMYHIGVKMQAECFLRQSVTDFGRIDTIAEVQPRLVGHETYKAWGERITRGEPEAVCGTFGTKK